MSKYCVECLTEHPEPDWPWEKFNKPVYWSLPNDGAKIKCRDCDENLNCSDVYLTQIPCGHRLVVCKECIDKHWLSIAEYKGVFDK